MTSKDVDGLLNVASGKESFKTEVSLSTTTLIVLAAIPVGSLILWGVIRYLTKP